MTKMMYRVFVKVGHYDIAFDFLTADKAGDFAKTLLLHQAATESDDDEAETSVRMEMFACEDADPVKHDGCRGCLHENKKEDEYPCCYCKGAYTDRYKKKED